MSSPRRAAKAVRQSRALRSWRGPPAALRAIKPAVAADNGASAEAKRVAATLERSIIDDKLDTVSAEALQKLIAAACRVYTARAPSRRAIHADAEEFDYRHRRHGHGERIVEVGRSRRVRARHVAKLDGSLNPPLERMGTEKTSWISSPIAVAA